MEVSALSRTDVSRHEGEMPGETGEFYTPRTIRRGQNDPCGSLLSRDVNNQRKCLGMKEKCLGTRDGIYPGMKENAWKMQGKSLGMKEKCQGKIPAE